MAGYTDIGFGTDGGKQAGMLRQAAKAGLRDWAMLKDSYDQDQVSVGHAGRRSASFTECSCSHLLRPSPAFAP